MNKIKLFLIIISLMCLRLQAAHAQSISGVINSYAKVSNISSLTLTVENINGNLNDFSPGSRVLIIQMKGATIEREDNSSYGSILALNGAGNYEYAIIKSRTGAGPSYTITLYNLTRAYDPSSYVQIVSVPQYTKAVVTSDVSAASWNRALGTGGIIAFDVKDTLTLQANISANGGGFAGGLKNQGSNRETTNTTAYVVIADNLYGQKGEGIADYGVEGAYAMGALANGGGGGNSHNAGGGGGGNYSAGGMGANSYYGAGGRGVGGKMLSYSDAENKIFMGGGGGGGQQNNGRASNGAAGGGIILIRSRVITSSCDNTYAITADGAGAPSTTGNDGGGGGGAGGVILLDVNSYDLACNINITTNGGKGADVNYTVAHPGGAGGGVGAIILIGSSGNANTIVSSTPGAPGKNCNTSSCTSTGTAGAACVGDGCDGTITWAMPLPNTPPDAQDDFAETNDDDAVEIHVLDNDSDADGNTLTISPTLVNYPSNGAVTLLGSVFTYTPEVNFSGTDSFTYTICDNGSPQICSSATVTITVKNVNDAPAVTDDYVTTVKNTAVIINVLGNDSDIENDQLTVSSTMLSGPEKGTLEVNADQTITYTPSFNVLGTDSFTYQVCDDGNPSECAAGTVYVNINNENYPPVAKDDFVIINEDEMVVIEPLQNDEDPDNEVLVLSASLVKAPSNGSFTITGNQVNYSPNKDFNGTDSFTYSICDSGSPVICSEAVVYITIHAVNDAPVATDDAFANKDVITEIKGNVLDNDYDVEGGNLTINISSSILLSNGVLQMNSDGSFTYVPESGFFGESHFEYEVCDDGEPSLCSRGFVRLEISGGVPKGFSPNGDGVNDKWVITGIEEFPNNKVIVMNRWGETVYETRKYDNETSVWTGEANKGLRLSQEGLPDGTYYYLIDFGNGSSPGKGFVVLKR